MSTPAPASAETLLAEIRDLLSAQAPMISVRAYAQMRGLSLKTVRNDIASGRVRRHPPFVDGWISDADFRQWMADQRAPLRAARRRIVHA